MAPKLRGEIVVRSSLFKSFNISVLIVKLVIPFFIASATLQYLGFIEYIAFLVNPISDFLSLPPSVAIAFVAAFFLNIYAGLAFAAGLSLSPYEWTIVGTFIAICHSIPTETAVMKKVGFPTHLHWCLRLLSALIGAWIAAAITPQEHVAISSKLLVSPIYSDIKEVLIAALIASTVLALKLIALVVSLIIGFDLLRKVPAVSALLDKNTYWSSLTVGGLLGVTHGARQLLKDIESVNEHHKKYLLLFLLLAHGLIEETLIFAFFGAEIAVIFLIRLGVALAAVFLIYLLAGRASKDLSAAGTTTLKPVLTAPLSPMLPASREFTVPLSGLSTVSISTVSAVPISPATVPIPSIATVPIPSIATVPVSAASAVTATHACGSVSTIPPTVVSLPDDEFAASSTSKTMAAPCKFIAVSPLPTPGEPPRVLASHPKHPDRTLSAAKPSNNVRKTPQYYLNRYFMQIAIALISIWLFLTAMSNNLPVPIAKAFDPFSKSLIIAVASVFMLSGVAKGLSGIGMGLICVPVVSLLYNPALAVSLIAVPLVITNFYQGFIAGDVLKTLKCYSVLALVMVVVMISAVYFSTHIPPLIVTWTIGLSAIYFVVLNVGHNVPQLSDRHDTAAQIFTGCTAGIVGGVTGLAVIPLVIYIMVRGIHKNQFVAVSGFLLFLSGIALLIGGSMNKTLTQDLFILSTLATLPAMVGALIGESLRAWTSEQVFRKIVLIIVFGVAVSALVRTL